MLNVDSVAEKAFISLQQHYSPPSASPYLDIFIVQPTQRPQQISMFGSKRQNRRSKKIANT